MQRSKFIILKPCSTFVFRMFCVWNLIFSLCGLMRIIATHMCIWDIWKIGRNNAKMSWNNRIYFPFRRKQQFLRISTISDTKWNPCICDIRRTHAQQRSMSSNWKAAAESEKDKPLAEVLMAEPQQIIMCLFNELFYYCDIKTRPRTEHSSGVSANFIDTLCVCPLIKGRQTSGGGAFANGT